MTIAQIIQYSIADIEKLDSDKFTQFEVGFYSGRKMALEYALQLIISGLELK